jgi:hypothetical protein
MRSQICCASVIALLAACGGGKPEAPEDLVCKAATSCGTSEAPGICPKATSTVTVSSEMTFFITGVGNGANGGNFGGIDGADARCNCLAAAAGQGQRTWRAYLSGVTGNARDRIGKGPWKNARGEIVAMDVASLHQDGLSARLIYDQLGYPVTEKVVTTSSTGMPRENLAHDVLTGSDADGRLPAGNPTCSDWRSAGMGNAIVGHLDWDLPTTGGNPSWNASHPTNGCSEGALRSTSGTGRIYCFATN